MLKVNLDEALTIISRRDPAFTPEIRKRLAPVKDRFFAPPLKDSLTDGLRTPPPYLAEADLRVVAIELAELALERGLDVNVPVEDDGTTFLHFCTLIRDPTVALETVRWLLSHGADPNSKRENGDTPLSLAEKLCRIEIVELFRDHRGVH